MAILERERVAGDCTVHYSLFIDLLHQMKRLLLFATLPIFFAGVSLHAQDSQAPTKAAATAKATNVTPDAAEKLLKEKKDLVVLDVRTAEEFQAGHIPGAKNLDFLSADFAKQLQGLDKSKEYLVHCAAGGRSSRACKLMDEEKFPKVYHLNE